jgi:putative membrane protein
VEPAVPPVPVAPPRPAVPIAPPVEPPDPVAPADPLAAPDPVPTLPADPVAPDAPVPLPAAPVVPATPCVPPDPVVPADPLVPAVPFVPALPEPLPPVPVPVESTGAQPRVRSPRDQITSLVAFMTSPVVWRRSNGSRRKGKNPCGNGFLAAASGPAPSPRDGPAGLLLSSAPMHTLLHLAAITLTVLLLARFVPSVKVKSLGSAIVVAIVFSLLNFFLGWVIKAVLFVPALFTFGLLFLFVPFIVNTVLLWLTDKLIRSFQIDSLGGLLVSSAVITLVNGAFHYAQHSHQLGVRGSGPTRWI